MRKLLLLLLLCSAALADNPYRILNSFSGGELSFLNSREDLSKFHSGCSIMENMIPISQGAAQKRPGTKYITEVKTSSLKTRLLPFGFSTSQSFIVEAGNQYFRFCTNGAQIVGSTGETATNPQPGDIVSRWKMNEIKGTSIFDDIGGLDGTCTVNVPTLAVEGQVGGALNFAGSYAVEMDDSASFTFLSGGVDTSFSISCWINFVSSGSVQGIISKWDQTTGVELREWWFYVDSADKLAMALFDENAGGSQFEKSDASLTDGWKFVTVTYDGSGGPEPADGITLYINGSPVASTKASSGSYVDMQDTATKPVMSGNVIASGSIGNFWDNEIDNLTIWKTVELSSAEVTTLYGIQTATSAYEIVTPYLTADLFNLKIEQSADVLYIAHPDYETRKLSRVANAAWVLGETDYRTGPFRTQNSDVSAKISASGTTGSVTLTATGGSPFKSGTTAGHLPSGSSATSKSQTGALFKLIHPLDTLSFSDTLEDDIGASSTEGVSWMSCGTLYKGATWTWTTGGTWLGQVAVQRNYTIGAAFADLGWETVLPFDGITTSRNVSESGSEDDGDADYRVAFLDDTSGTVISYFTTDQTEVDGVVEITAVASPTSATATVLSTLASTDATYKWSESSWSNYRGWPQTVTFFEDRLCFGGNTSQPDTIWSSVTGDYDNMTAGPDDDEALIFTLSSRQVNVIEWIIGKDKLLIGTSGAEWSIAGGTDEPLTPSNAIAKQHSTFGSSSLQAGIANESILFFQRGARKMRELAYNWESDSYVAPDMTILSSLVTTGGITGSAFQRTPDSMLWSIRTDGELPVFAYERNENVTAWSRVVTTDGTADSDFESVAVINGSPEDEVWVVVERTINGGVVRYIEQFQPRGFSDACDAFFVDCGVTYDSTASSAMTGLTHLEGETVYVLADGVVFDSEVVSSGAITLSLDNVTTTASTVQMGLPYEVNMRTMPISIVGGETIHGKQKRISEVVAEWYLSGDFSIGKDASSMDTYGITGQSSGIDRKTFPPGWDRNGYIYIYQKSPEPLTLMSIMAEFNLQ